MPLNQPCEFVDVSDLFCQPFFLHFRSPRRSFGGQLLPFRLEGNPQETTVTSGFCLLYSGSFAYVGDAGSVEGDVAL
jgi:hypothetical protein